jgi:hypothetical protein
MKPEIKKLWVEALRSGKYKQAKEALRTDNKKAHCCLGVLCEIYVTESHGIVDWLDAAVLPEDVAKWAGLDGNFDPECVMLPTKKRLTELNDGKGYGFKRISNLIEKYL